VSEEYLEHLLVLARKIAFINSNDAARGSQARRDVEAVLEKLRNRAIAKVGHGSDMISINISRQPQQVHTSWQCICSCATVPFLGHSSRVTSALCQCCGLWLDFESGSELLVCCA
jgi:hypothetical protein